MSVASQIWPLTPQTQECLLSMNGNSLDCITRELHVQQARSLGVQRFPFPYLHFQEVENCNPHPCSQEGVLDYFMPASRMYSNFFLTLTIWWMTARLWDLQKVTYVHYVYMYVICMKTSLSHMYMYIKCTINVLYMYEIHVLRTQYFSWNCTRIAMTCNFVYYNVAKSVKNVAPKRKSIPNLIIYNWHLCTEYTPFAWSHKAWSVLTQISQLNVQLHIDLIPKIWNNCLVNPFASEAV